MSRNNLSCMVNKDFHGRSVLKNPPAMQEMLETRVLSLGQEDPLEKEKASHFSILVWKISWTEEPGELQFMGSQQSMGSQEPDTT